MIEWYWWFIGAIWMSMVVLPKPWFQLYVRAIRKVRGSEERAINLE